MSFISQLPISSQQVADSASSVATSLARPRSTSSQGPSASGTTSSQSVTAADSTITANDFLTLLVAEMKNQDPTQPTDPNAYISQMVNVNSLQQLIGINQGVSALDAATGATTGNSTSPVS